MGISKAVVMPATVLAGYVMLPGTGKQEIFFLDENREPGWVISDRFRNPGFPVGHPKALRSTPSGRW